MVRRWYVHATPVKGFIPSENDITIDPSTGYANKVVTGPFPDPYACASFIDRNRPMQTWNQVAIISKKEKYT